jgi:hypothetical protein
MCPRGLNQVSFIIYNRSLFLIYQVSFPCNQRLRTQEHKHKGPMESKVSALRRESLTWMRGMKACVVNACAPANGVCGLRLWSILLLI